MSYTVTRESFESLASYWADPHQKLNWSSVFVLPAWLKTWWQEFGGEAELCLIGVKQGDEVAGIAPLMVQGSRAVFLGSTDVCDYQDFIVTPGREEEFFNTLLADLKNRNIDHLDLKALRPDATVLSHLVPLARSRHYEVTLQAEDVSLEMDLPATWEEYLVRLDKKQRHELKRKLRRLWAAGNVAYRCHDGNDDFSRHLTIFLNLFAMSQREEKASFMTPRMESFFRALATAMAGIGLLRLGALELDTQPVAMTMGFDYHEGHYLYNSGYDPKYSSLSVGLLSKALCLKESIEKGRGKWDFLKGSEPYKYQLGGQEITLHRCQIEIR